MIHLGLGFPQLAALIYNWATSEWNEYFEYASTPDLTDTLEMQCAQIIHDEKMKVYVMMSKRNDISRYFMLLNGLIVS